MSINPFLKSQKLVEEGSFEAQNAKNPSMRNASVRREGTAGAGDLADNSSGHARGTSRISFVSARSRLTTGNKAELRDMGHDLHPWVILPNESLYLYWWAITVLGAFLTAVYEPLAFAFISTPGLYPYTDTAGGFKWLLLSIFTADLVVSFFLAYHDKKSHQLVTDLRDIQLHYLKFLFWVDLTALIPWDLIFMAGFGVIQDEATDDSTLTLYLAILKWVSLLRLYRVYHLFVRYMEYNMKMSQLAVTLIRNQIYVVFMLHFQSCWWYWLARINYFTSDTWFGSFPVSLETRGVYADYIASFYYCTVTFGTVGYGDIHALSTNEFIFMIFVVLMNVIVCAYIVGTVTNLVVRADERVKDYRMHMLNLQAFAKKNRIEDKALHHSMQDHLEMHLEHQHTSDEALLEVYPTTIRRRILRTLYLSKVTRCYLFTGCSKKFLDAYLASARIETFLPEIELASEGEAAHELSMLVSGEAEILAIKALGGALVGEGSVGSSRSAHRNYSVVGEDRSSADRSSSSNDVSVRDGGGRRDLRPGDMFGETSFFTETPMLQPVVSRDVCSVLVVTRSAWASLTAEHAVDVRRVLENLQSKCEQEVLREVAKAGISAAELSDSDTIGLIYKLAYTSKNVPLQGTPLAGVSQAQKQVIANTVHVRSCVLNYVAKVDCAQTTEFLGAAARGDMDLIKQMLLHGHDINACDYDKRSALMVAAGKGEPALLTLLLDAGANPNLTDVTGSTALLDACKAGNDGAIKVLRRRGASLQGVEPGRLVSMMCMAVFTGDNRLLSRLLKAGCNASLGDWDSRTALHIAAAEGNKEGVRVLVEEGGASVELRDRWGSTPLDDAKRVGARPVIDYIERVMAEGKKWAPEGLKGGPPAPGGSPTGPAPLPVPPTALQASSEDSAWKMANIHGVTDAGHVPPVTAAEQPAAAAPAADVDEPAASTELPLPPATAVAAARAAPTPETGGKP